VRWSPSISTGLTHTRRLRAQTEEVENPCENPCERDGVETSSGYPPFELDMVVEETKVWEF
jgi:hypothetical protein